MFWYCFLFCSGYRFILALLAHFNWFTAIYVNCIYFALWKSYDLLWFWMHLILCICFKPLRTRNFLIVWCNLIYKRFTVYRNSTYKEIYKDEYRTPQKLRKQRSDKINELVTFDYEEEDQNSDDDNQDIDAVKIERRESEESMSQNPKISGLMNVVALGPDEEGHECMQQIEPNATDSNASVWLQDDCNDAPIPPPRLKKQTEKAHEDQNDETGSYTPMCWKQFGRLHMILKSLKSSKHRRYCSPCRTEKHSLDDAVKIENNKTDNASNAGNQVKLVVRILRFLPLVQGCRDSTAVEDEIDVLTPDFTNKRDLTNAREIHLRQKHDRRMLRRRLQARKRAELALIAKHEAKQKTIAMAVQLMLQILQMMASFAILVGNIRKTFIPTHFSSLKHSRNQDHLGLILFWRCTIFLYVLLFWIGIFWTYCKQWRLCCRLGLIKFWMWLSILSLIGGLFVIYPMLYVHDNLDISWCQFKPNTTLAHYQQIGLISLLFSSA